MIDSVLWRRANFRGRSQRRSMSRSTGLRGVDEPVRHAPAAPVVDDAVGFKRTHAAGASAESTRTGGVRMSPRMSRREHEGSDQGRARIREVTTEHTNRSGHIAHSHPNNPRTCNKLRHVYM